MDVDVYEVGVFGCCGRGHGATYRSHGTVVNHTRYSIQAVGGWWDWAGLVRA